MLRLTSFSLKTSTAALARSSVSDSIVTASSPAQAIEVPVPRKSNRCESSFAAWLRALSTSCRSTLLTTSNDGSATACLLVDRAPAEPGWSLSYPWSCASAHPGGLPEWPKGADCKSVGSAYEGSNPSPATPGVTAPDLRKRGSGAVLVCLRSSGRRHWTPSTVIG